MQVICELLRDIKKVSKLKLLVYKFLKQKHATRMYLRIESKKQATRTVFRD